MCDSPALPGVQQSLPQWTDGSVGMSRVSPTWPRPCVPCPGEEPLSLRGSVAQDSCSIDRLLEELQLFRSSLSSSTQAPLPLRHEPLEPSKGRAWIELSACSHKALAMYEVDHCPPSLEWGVLCAPAAHKTYPSLQNQDTWVPIFSAHPRHGLPALWASVSSSIPREWHCPKQALMGQMGSRVCTHVLFIISGGVVLAWCEDGRNSQDPSRVRE